MLTDIISFLMASTSHDITYASSIDAKSNSIKNMNLIEYENIQEQLNKWTIPTVQPSTIYKKGMFNLISSMVIKTME